MSFNIAIDGPAGAGKSTIAKQLAKELSFYICRYRSHVSEYGIVFYEKWHCKGR